MHTMPNLKFPLRNYSKWGRTLEVKLQQLRLRKKILFIYTANNVIVPWNKKDI